MNPAGTQLAIRERDFVELLDLALPLVRRRVLGLSIAAVGVLPVMLVNAWLLRSLTAPVDLDTLVDGRAAWYLVRAVYVASVLVIVEMPLVTAPLTLLLGQYVFSREPQPRQIAGQFFRSLPQLLLLQVMPRLLLAPWVVTWPLLFALWPFAGEVILLERNPLFRRQGNSTLSRAAHVQPRHRGGPVWRWIVTSLVGGLLIVTSGMTLYYLRGMLTSNWRLDLWAHLFLFQMAIWIWVCFFAVVRFLSYLDTRIRNEGWELELLMRAEGARLEEEIR